MKVDIEPKLAPPGAGLPRVELMVARTLFRWRKATLSRQEFAARFAAERARIRSQVSAASPEELRQRALIERVRGLEDSSRYWSVLMTLEHLRIVHRGVQHTIKMLAREKTIDRVVSTAAVKPAADVTEKVIEDYEASCDALIEETAAIRNLRTKTRHAHPWFGLLDAFGWHALAAGHLAIHRMQIDRILETQRKETPRTKLEFQPEVGA